MIVGNRRKPRISRVMRFSSNRATTLAHESIFRIMLFSIALYRMEAAPVREFHCFAHAGKGIDQRIIGETAT
jgi:hypothetical protein